MLERSAILGLLLAILFSACIEESSLREAKTVARKATSTGVGASVLGAVAELDLSSRSSVSIMMEDTGWGRIELHAKESLQIDVSVSHETFTNLTTYPQGARGVYTEQNFTVIYVFREGEHPAGPQSFYFEWLGNPYPSVFPASSARSPSVTPPKLGAGEFAILLVATSVPGFIVDLTTGPADSNRTYTWLLGTHPDLQHTIPIPKATAVAENHPLYVAKHIELATGKLRMPAQSLAIARFWRVGIDGATIGIVQDEYGFASQRTSGAPPRPSPSLSFGAAFAGYSWQRKVFVEPSEMELWRVVDYTCLSTAKLFYGAGLLVVPLA